MLPDAFVTYVPDCTFFMLSAHDEALLKDLRLQPVALLIAYVALGVAALAAGLLVEHELSPWLCAGGGFLIALGAEKLVSRRIRQAASALLRERGSQRDAG